MSELKHKDVRQITVNGVDLVVNFSRAPSGATVRAEIQATGEYVETVMSFSGHEVMDKAAAAALLRAVAHELEVGAL